MKRLVLLVWPLICFLTINTHSLSAWASENPEDCGLFSEKKDPELALLGLNVFEAGIQIYGLTGKVKAEISEVNANTGEKDGGIYLLVTERDPSLHDQVVNILEMGSGSLFDVVFFIRE